MSVGGGGHGAGHVHSTKRRAGVEGSGDVVVVKEMGNRTRTRSCFALTRLAENWEARWIKSRIDEGEEGEGGNDSQLVPSPATAG